MTRSKCSGFTPAESWNEGVALLSGGQLLFIPEPNLRDRRVIELFRLQVQSFPVRTTPETVGRLVPFV